MLETIWHIVERRRMRPAIILSYTRRAFRSRDGSELRITFDTYLRARSSDLDLRLGPYGSFVISPSLSVMEIKAHLGVPSWVSRIVNACDCRHQTFSKYCQGVRTCRCTGVVYG
jgi:SPX domain protein involved in polyphosphate accumulation